MWYPCRSAEVADFSPTVRMNELSLIEKRTGRFEIFYLLEKRAEIETPPSRSRQQNIGAWSLLILAYHEDTMMHMPRIVFWG